MPSICDEITDDIVVNCDNQPVGGVKPTMYVMNLNDIEAVTYDATNPLIVTGITMKDGKKAFKYEVFKRGHKPRFTKVNGEYGDRYRHEVDTSIQVWDNKTKAQVMGLFGSAVVVIFENLQAQGDARFEIYGITTGLYVADGATRNLNENEGVLTYTLGSEDGALEPKIPHTFAKLTANVYSYVDTLTALEALTVEAV